MTIKPARLGIRGALLERYRAAGWLDGEDLKPSAERLLTAITQGPDAGGARGRLAAIVESEPAMAADLLTDPRLGDAAVAISGASRALADVAAASPAALRAAAGGTIRGVLGPFDTGDPGRASRELRDAVRLAMLGIAVADLTGRLTMPEVGLALSDLADQAAEAALATASAGQPGTPARLAVIAMGKWGGRELNYASDIDLLFVTDDGDIDAAIALAREMIDLLGGRGDGAFRVDADLRPEGRRGPLVRSLDSYRAYWERWAETWESQALLKARPVAGSEDLGDAFIAAAEPYVFPETLGAEAVREIRAMKTRAEAGVAAPSEDVEIKRGVGGIRDVEFAIQLLQLVHGRSDAALRGANTLEALRVLGAGGYLRDEDAATLTEAYGWLRDVEHRLQMYELRQTHTLPADPARRDRTAKAMGYRDDPARTAAEAFDADLVERRAEVRTIHERLFYRPLLEAFAASPAVRLTEEGAARQLAALGYSDTEAARRAFADLTGGLSRRSRLMQQMLPLMLDWLSSAPDPDLGLAQLRMLVTSSSDNAEVIAALRDNPVAAERLCSLLGTSRLLGRLVDRIPASLARLGVDDRLAAFPEAGALREEAAGVITVRSNRADRISALRRFSQSHQLWVASLDLTGSADHASVGRMLSSIADAVAAASLEIARAETGHSEAALGIVAMGKWGGAELNYASDLDALIVHSSGDDDATAAATEVAEAFVTVIDAVAADGPGRGIDLDLRPEGKRGAITRSLDSYRTYYDRWAETWEFQALLRARPVAGTPELLDGFMASVGPMAVRPGFSAERDVLAMKARMEIARIPAGEDPDFHMKLGRGGMADIEWTVQLNQMQHGAADPGVVVPATLEGLTRLEAGGWVDPGDAEILREAYAFCATVRNRLYLQAGRARDSLPADQAEVTRLARSLGYEMAPRTALREAYRRITRRARRVVERLFYGVEPGHRADPQP